MFKLYGVTENGQLEFLNTYFDLVGLQIEAMRIFTNKAFKVFDQHGNFVQDLY